MGIFGGEKYSKEAYKGAERAKENLEKDQDDPVYLIGGLAGPGAREHDEREKRVRGRLEELLGKGNAEAEKMNEEYDRLLARAQEAVKAVTDFEKEKLGMSSVKE